MTTYTLQFTQKLVSIECCNCHMIFAMGEQFVADRREDHNWWFCPAGHQQRYSGLSDLERAQRTQAELRRQLASRDDDVRAARMRTETERRSHAATKGKLTRAVKRAEKGVCLHCNRHFVNVERHVKSQHPDQAATPALEQIS